ncbi:MAG TPA: 4'-phosphopantetheinyl transferase superfamily protein [Thermoanaerobaculia bacterium]|nr:4'-phosphopantetheinyl transferase superfamily protein [Thermoanaerobaculia bacterium]
MVRDADVPPLQPLWPPGAPEAPPEPGEVQLWLADLDRPPVPLEGLAATLAPDESARAARFHFDVHRRRFTAGRGLLRLLLGRLLDRPPAALAFRYGAKGKPELDLPAGAGLRFNLSHSANGALIAVAPGRTVGADLEWLRPLDDAEALVERFFHPAERRVFAAVAPEERLACFYAGWTRKEAYVKARGDGLSLPTTEFEVVLASGEPPRLVRFEREPGEVGRWSFAAFEPARGFLGAVAVEGEAPALTTRFWAG